MSAINRDTRGCLQDRFNAPIERSLAGAVWNKENIFSLKDRIGALALQDRLEVHRNLLTPVLRLGIAADDDGLLTHGSGFGVFRQSDGLQNRHASGTGF